MDNVFNEIYVVTSQLNSLEDGQEALRQSIESMSEQIRQLSKLLGRQLSGDVTTESSGDKRGISETNPTPTKEPQAARQKTPATESPERSAKNAWSTSTLHNQISQRMASSDCTNLSAEAMDIQDEYAEKTPPAHNDVAFFARCADEGLSVEAIARLKNQMDIQDEYAEIEAAKLAMSQSQAAEKFARGTEALAALERSTAAFGQ